MFEKLHFCNHLGQPTYIDDIRCHINEGKTDKEISDMKAIKILRNASDNKDLFYYLVFRLGVAENWGNLAGEAIQEIEKRRKCKLKIEGKDCVYKQLSKEDCEVLENLYQLGYVSNAQKELKEIEDERDKAIAKAQKEYEIKKAVVSFGISWSNVIFYDHSNKLCFNYSDCYKKIPSDLINDSEKESSLNDKERGETKQAGKDNSIQPKEEKPIVQYTDDMLELISLDLDSMTYTVNGDIGTEKDIASIVLYDKIGKIVVFFEDGEKRECLFDGESILQSVLKDNLK